jgi:transcriptional regulator GlxA family with amidase domain
VVAEALDRLVNTDDKVEVIALEVGFKSRSALGMLLRRHGLPSPESCRVSNGTGRG